MGRVWWRVLLFAAAGATLPRAELAGQAARADGHGLPDSWRAAVYSFKRAPDDDATLEMLQLLPQTSPLEGRFVHVRVDRARDRYERREGRYRIQDTELLLHDDDAAGAAPLRARYFGTLICVDGPPGAAPRAFRFVQPPGRHTPPPPWPASQRRPPSGC